MECQAIQNIFLNDIKEKSNLKKFIKLEELFSLEETLMIGELDPFEESF